VRGRFAVVGAGLGWLVLGCLVMPAAFAQDAVVTFYSHGSNLTSGLPGSKHGIYFGIVYDGNQALLSFREGFVGKNNRFAVFRVPAGSHTFSASYSSHPSKGHSLTIELKAGQDYFIRAQSESSGIGIVEVEHGRLDEVSCTVANEETAKAKALPLRVISSKMSGNLLQPQLVPSCP
jgi:hypothetical protein